MAVFPLLDTVGNTPSLPLVLCAGAIATALLLVLSRVEHLRDARHFCLGMAALYVGAGIAIAFTSYSLRNHQVYCRSYHCLSTIHPHSGFTVVGASLRMDIPARCVCIAVVRVVDCGIAITVLVLVALPTVSPDEHRV